MEKKKINANIIADSIDERGNRITSYILTYPRIIHAEVMTHRMFSRNAASSRAIPFAKMLKDIQEDPFIPIAWQKDHKGMQGSEYFTMEDNKQLLRSGKYYSDLDKLEERWLTARDKAVQFASDLSNNGLTKQLCNRLLEPFQWYTCLITATEFDNFFELRCPQYCVCGTNREGKDDYISYKSKKDLLKVFPDYYINESSTVEEWQSLNTSQAEIHIQALAEAMWDAKNESVPKYLKAGEWHIPFGDSINDGKAAQAQSPNIALGSVGLTLNDVRIKIATARCARLSYMTFEGEINYEKDIKLHDQLLEGKHFSPFEHCLRAMSSYEYEVNVKGEAQQLQLGGVELPENASGWCNNYKGFIPYRYLLENKEE